MESNSQEGRVFFYYPGPGKKRKGRRIVLAGIVKGDKILVSEAVLFPGKEHSIVNEALVESEDGEKGMAFVMLDDAVPADTYNKKVGRGIALDKCRGYYYNIDKKMKGVDYINGTYTDLKGEVHKLTPIPQDQEIVLTIDIPKGEELLGRVFVQGVTKVYPPKPPKIKPEEPKFTVEQITKYLESLGIMPNQPLTPADIQTAWEAAQQPTG